MRASCCRLAAGARFVAAVAPDGRSMAPFLVAGVGDGGRGKWRDAWLSEYKSVGTYYGESRARLLAARAPSLLARR